MNDSPTTTFIKRIKAKRFKFNAADTATLISMHNAGETLNTISLTLERPFGTIATKVRELIAKGILKNRLLAATGSRPHTRKAVQS